MGRGGIGGQMAQVARRRAQAQATKKTLNIDQERGAPQAPVRQNQPPGQIPKEETAAQSTPQENMAAMTERFFQEVRQPGAVPSDQPPARVTRPPPEPGMVTDRVGQLGAGGLSSVQQFYRLAGRMPTPRDLAVFRVALMLEEQLGRKPTAIELRVALSRPTLLSTAAPAAVEA